MPARGPVARAPPTGPRPAPAPAVVRPPMPVSTHVRASVAILVLTVLVGGIAYPAAIVGFAQVVSPATANGSLVHAPNGTVVGSSLLAPPLLLPWTFWPRPSEVGYNPFNGSDGPPGPGDPALVNETLSYQQEYANLSGNATVPLWLITPSGSGVDPDITPGSAYFQVPRVQAEVEIVFGVALTTPMIDGLVASYVQGPAGGLPGPSYVDVTTLNVALWALIHG